MVYIEYSILHINMRRQSAKFRNTKSRFQQKHKMWVLLKDFLLVSMGMGIGVVLMCILNVGKEADYKMKQLKESEDN